MRILLLALAAMLPAAATAAECSARSGPATAVLAELYTSEGCSSCPPADRWLSTLPGSGALARRVVPLAFHVDYWDSIGWKDRFASPDFTRRQREGARLPGSSSVYTPQVRLAGRDFRGWHSPPAFSQALAEAGSRPARAELGIAARGSGGMLRVSVEAAAKDGPGDLVLFLALTESRLETAVGAGENRGETLRHDHVVRALRSLGALDDSGRRNETVAWPLDAGWKREDLAIAAFLQDRGTGEVVQALRLPLCPG